MKTEIFIVLPSGKHLEINETEVIPLSGEAVHIDQNGTGVYIKHDVKSVSHYFRTLTKEHSILVHVDLFDLVK